MRSRTRLDDAAFAALILLTAAACTPASPAARNENAIARDTAPLDGVIAFDDSVVDAINVEAVNDAHEGPCALRSDGSVWCWRSRPLRPRDGIAPFVAERVSIPTASPAVDIAVGTWFSCARMTDGSVYCWHNDGISSSPPKKVALPAGAAKLSVAKKNREQDSGPDAAALLSDNKVFAWTHATNGWSDPAPSSAAQPLEQAVGHSTREACEEDVEQNVRCKGVGELFGGMNTPAELRRPIADPSWRDVPALHGAADLGVNEFCGWGIVGPDRLREDCISDPIAAAVCTKVGEACTAYRKDVVRRDGWSFNHEVFEIRFPNLRKMLSADVGIDKDGRCFRVEKTQILRPCGGAEPTASFLDVVRDDAGYYVLDRNGRVEFLSSFPGGKATVVRMKRDVTTDRSSHP